MALFDRLHTSGVHSNIWPYLVSFPKQSEILVENRHFVIPWPTCIRRSTQRRYKVW